jgi:hypothetical protein
MSIRRTTIAFFCLTLLTTVRVRAESNAEYSDLLKDGVNEFSAGNWGEARLLFTKAHKIAPTARTFRGLGLCDFELRHYVAAIAEFEAAVNDQRRALTPDLRRQVEHALDLARQYVARYQLRVPSGVRELKVDGQVVPLPDSRELLLDPGSHTVTVQPSEGDPIVRAVVTEVGARAELAFEAKPAAPIEPAEVAKQAASAEEVPAPYLPPQSSHAGPRTFTWVAAGLTGVFGAGIAVFGLTASAKHSRFVRQSDAHAEQPDTTPPPDPALVNSGKTYQLLTNVSIIGCSVAGVATIALFFIEGSAKQERASEAAPVQAGVGLGGAYVHGRF